MEEVIKAFKDIYTKSLTLSKKEKKKAEKEIIETKACLKLLNDIESTIEKEAEREKSFDERLERIKKIQHSRCVRYHNC